MSTWTSRSVLFVLGLAGLSACEDIDLPALGAARGAGPEPSITVARGSVVIAGPRGYCVDRKASRPGGAQPFVLLASCLALGAEEGTPRVAQPGLLTATVRQAPPGGEGDTALIQALQTYFTSANGQAALARDGQAASVDILHIERHGSALDLHLTDKSPPIPPGTAPDYWRSVFLKNGQIVTLSVLSFAAQPLEADVGQATLEAFRRAIRAASPRTGGGAVVSDVQTAPLELLRRLRTGN